MVAKLHFTAGNFEIEAWSDGHPMWTTIRHNGGPGDKVISGIHHRELKDLAFVLGRMQAAVRADLARLNLQHEMD